MPFTRPNKRDRLVLSAGEAVRHDLMQTFSLLRDSERNIRDMSPDIERETETERERERDRERHRERHRERQRQTDRQTDRDRDKDKDRETEGQRETETETETERQRQRSWMEPCSGRTPRMQALTTTDAELRT